MQTHIYFRKYFFIFLLLFGGQKFYAQSSIIFHKLSGNDISPQSIAYAVKQDSIGNLWIATEEGVFKYDSKKFKIYNTYHGLPGIVSNRTLELLIDSKQRLWLGMEKGVCLYNKSFDRFDLIGKKSNINPAYVTAIIEDQNNNIWFGGYNGLWKLHTDMSLEQYIPNHNIHALLSYKNVIIIGTPEGLFFFNPKSERLEQISLSKSKNIRSLVKLKGRIFAGTQSGDIYELDKTTLHAKSLVLSPKISKPIFDIATDNLKNYYIGTDGEGLYKFNSNFELIGHYTEDPNNPNSISSNGIYDLEKGKENIMWVATYGGGVNYFHLNPPSFKNIKHEVNNPNSISSNFTRAISKDKTGKIWFGTKQGVSIWNPKNNKWKHLLLQDQKQNPTQTIVLSLEPDEDYMWIGTYGSGLYKINIHNFKQQNSKGLKLNQLELTKIYSLLKDSKNNLWIGGIEKKLSILRPDLNINTYPISDIKSLVEAKNGDIIVGCRDGVYIINDSLHQFKHLQSLLPGNKLAYSKVNSIYETKKGELIIATNGAGLIFYNPKDGTKKILNVRNGLASDIIQGILATNDYNFWVSTTKGLAHVKISQKDTLIHIYNKNDGLTSTEYNFGSYNKLNDSLFAFGGVNGVSLFNPFYVKEKALLPQIVFDEFKISNKKITPGKKPLEFHINETQNVNLTHNQNSFEIKFTGILQNNPTQVKYSWKLEGFDKEWTSPEHTNFATYTNLNPGYYTFRVKAFNKFGIAGPERKIYLKIAPPWWSTKTAFFIYGLLILGILFLVIHFTSVMVNKKHADEQIDFFNNITHEIKTPLAVLISSLENITAKAEFDDSSKKRIKTTVNRISSLFEQMLNFHRFTSDKHFNEEIHEINIEAMLNRIINNFTPLIKKRNLNIHINNYWGDEPYYFNKEILQKILQNLISNAIKYSFDNGNITINTYKTNQGQLKIEVIDEGLGIPKDQQKFILNRYYRARNAINSQRPGTGLGLIMVKKLIDKTNGSIKFVSRENKGTKFIVTLKNQIKKYKDHIVTKAEEIPQLRDELEDQTELDNYSDAKILIVEDNDELRETLVKSLSNYFQIYEAKNGKEGLEIAHQIHPDVILTDLIMPEMDGMQMAQMIKEDINLNHIPIFMMSVLHSSSQKLKSAETGISSYIEKPINMKYLLAKIINTLKLQKKLREKFIHENDIDNATLYRNKSDQEFLKKLEKIVLENIENSNFSVHDLSEKMGMSRTSLYMKLKNLVDLSPQDFIIHTKLRLAKNLLIKGEMSIKEVAYSSGFSNPKYFSTVFKKFHNMSPRQFLESIKKNN